MSKKDIIIILVIACQFFFGVVNRLDMFYALILTAIFVRLMNMDNYE